MSEPPRTVDLDTPLVTTVGKKSADTLATDLGLWSVGDLLLHLPRRYEERGELTRLKELEVGDQVTVQARVQSCSGRRIRNKLHKTDVVITDGDGVLTLTFFNQIWRERQLRPGATALFAGKVDVFRNKRQLTNPEVMMLSGDELDPLEASFFAGSIIPVYPATAKAPTWLLSKAIQTTLDVVDIRPEDDPVPPEIRARKGLLGFQQALEAVHRPATRDEANRGKDRLRYDEAFVLQVALARRRLTTEQLPATPRPVKEDGLLAAFDAALPYTLTKGQAEIGEQVSQELATAHPMHRLLQGEVGSGKTVCAVRAALQVVDGGGQAAILAPTEVLALQHARGVRDLLGPLGRAGELDGADDATRLTLLTGSTTAAARRKVLAEIASGSAGIVVGTHALLEDTVQWADLGLVVVDEQHRFGVEQRDALRARGADGGATPHVLVMTATPIPRTVAMTVYGDLEVSTLTELPGGRQPIQTFVVPPELPKFIDRAWGRIRDEVAAGHQAFVVCPRISSGNDAGGDLDPADLPPPESEGPVPGAAVEDVLPELREGELKGLRVEALHGKLHPDDKDAVMRRFAAGDIDVLVATTVIEVGIDVPNSTVMVVLDADRFGVSQLHQLRGRVGRGKAASWCLLQTSAQHGTPARERLEAVAGTLDGAELALVDLEQRREGNVLGASQSGKRTRLKLLDLLKHGTLIRDAREDAVDVVKSDPDLMTLPGLRRVLAATLDEAEAAFLQKG